MSSNEFENPNGVEPIDFDNLSDLAVHKDTQQLYWRGKQVVIKRKISLRRYEIILATLASFSAVGILVLDVYKTFFLTH